jgi:hypothetical protein
MIKRKLTAANPIRKRLHVSTVYYPPLEAKRYAGVRAVPYIRLRGHWLSEAGFGPNDAIGIVATPGRVVLTKL